MREMTLLRPPGPRPDSIGAACRAHAENRGITTAIVARRLGVSEQRARQLFVAENMTLASAMRLAEAVGLRLALVSDEAANAS
jgi:plasmid maintenance system antidote protein VapI